jgi:prevent-host-death family protein
MTMDDFMNAAESIIGAGEFKAGCLKLLDDVALSRRSLVITKHGKPVARVVPMPADVPLFGALAGTVLRDNDLLAPLDLEWDAVR